MFFFAQCFTVCRSSLGDGIQAFRQCLGGIMFSRVQCFKVCQSSLSGGIYAFRHFGYVGYVGVIFCLFVSTRAGACVYIQVLYILYILVNTCLFVYR